jgi:hypothetical protein
MTDLDLLDSDPPSSCSAGPKVDDLVSFYLATPLQEYSADILSISSTGKRPL